MEKKEFIKSLNIVIYRDIYKTEAYNIKISEREIKDREIGVSEVINRETIKINYKEAFKDAESRNGKLKAIVKLISDEINNLTLSKIKESGVRVTNAILLEQWYAMNTMDIDLKEEICSVIISNTAEGIQYGRVDSVKELGVSKEKDKEDEEDKKVESVVFKDVKKIKKFKKRLLVKLSHKGLFVKELEKFEVNNILAKDSFEVEFEYTGEESEIEFVYKIVQSVNDSLYGIIDNFDKGKSISEAKFDYFIKHMVKVTNLTEDILRKYRYAMIPYIYIMGAKFNMMAKRYIGGVCGEFDMTVNLSDENLISTAVRSKSVNLKENE